MITYMGYKVTANELAKLLVADKGGIAQEFWSEDSSIAIDLMTEREMDAVGEAIDKQAERVFKLLGFWELREKVFSREDRSEEIQEKLWRRRDY